MRAVSSFTWHPSLALCILFSTRGLQPSLDRQWLVTGRVGVCGGGGSRDSSLGVSNWHRPGPCSLPASTLHLYSFLPSPEMPLQFSCDHVFVLTHYYFVCWLCQASSASLLWALIGGGSTTFTHPKGKTSALDTGKEGWGLSFLDCRGSWELCG